MCKKLLLKCLVKLTPGFDITDMFTYSFYARRSQKRKMTDDLTVIFYTCEIDLRCDQRFALFQFVLVATTVDDDVDDINHVDEMSLIDRDVIGQPLSDADDVEIIDEDVWRNALNATDGGRKDPIEGGLFEGDISGVRLVSR